LHCDNTLESNLKLCAAFFAKPGNLMNQFFGICLKTKPTGCPLRWLAFWWGRLDLHGDQPVYLGKEEQRLAI